MEGSVTRYGDDAKLQYKHGKFCFYRLHSSIPYHGPFPHLDPQTTLELFTSSGCSTVSVVITHNQVRETPHISVEGRF